MLDIHDSVDALMSRVLAACRDSERLAVQLARNASLESLRQLLLQRADSYRNTAHELRRGGCDLAFDDGDEPEVPGDALQRDADVGSVWEAIECSTLICFRDALDAELPAGIDAIVRRSIEDGVSALEQLRSLPRE